MFSFQFFQSFPAPSIIVPANRNILGSKWRHIWECRKGDEPTRKNMINDKFVFISFTKSSGFTHTLILIVRLHVFRIQTWKHKRFMHFIIHVWNTYSQFNQNQGFEDLKDFPPFPRFGRLNKKLSSEQQSIACRMLLIVGSIYVESSLSAKVISSKYSCELWVVIPKKLIIMNQNYVRAPL